MKALLLSDEINHFHWSMLKSVLLVLSLLPLSQFFINLVQGTDTSSQIVLGFLAISIFSAFTIISFYSALNATVMQINLQSVSSLEKQLVQIYRYLPMLCLTVMVSYLATQI
ncbi:hypothetical protein [Acinetobacter sp. ANC 4648]|uniref:hypothetical protein n=1 Tax=Acinetobacter sp. ANC 4648 TaxID=1977875 RepID=UPI000A34B737|nr:hypothetical protein [Acinetobacter sp. ANC 4648]OTG84894.1 hypothetical protein B9T27_01335 [Acinetobacter sp. ANC 4648]